MSVEMQNHACGAIWEWDSVSANGVTAGQKANDF